MQLCSLLFKKVMSQLLHQELSNFGLMQPRHNCIKIGQEELLEDFFLREDFIIVLLLKISSNLNLVMSLLKESQILELQMLQMDLIEISLIQILHKEPIWLMLYMHQCQLLDSSLQQMFQVAHILMDLLSGILISSPQ